MADPPITERHKHHFHRKSPIKEPVRAATTANITIATALNNADVLDGVTLATGDRVLVKDQSAGSQNGIYVVGASPARAYDLSTDDPDVRGAEIRVLEGTVNGSTTWVNTNTTLPTIGTTALTFTAMGGSGAPTTADYLVGTAQAGLSAEIVVGTTPGGELGGTWGSPTVDTTHAGSDHLQPVRKNSAGSVFSRRRLNLIEGSNVTLTVADDAGDDEVDVTIAASVSGSGLTVEDEGTPLATDATTLDFVGAGVTASGAGATKTITIPGGGGTSDDNEASASVLIDATSTGDAGGRADHFPGTSLSGAWSSEATAVSTSGVKYSALSELRGGGENHRVQAYTPSGAFRIEARVSLDGGSVGLMARDSTAGVAGHGAMILAVFDSVVQLYTLEAGAWTSRGVAGGTWRGQWIYLALERDGSNNWRGSWSQSRANWRVSAAHSKTFTVAKAGFRNDGGQANYDFFDVVS
jgi:hypothetical protein